MKKSIGFWQMLGFIFSAVSGTILHFVFDWTGGNGLAALFSAVNESIWEHMKLLFYPMVIFACVEYRYWGREIPSFWCVKLVGILVGLALIPALYYTYTGILGMEADWFNITIFFISAGYAYWLESRLLQKERVCRLPKGAALALIVLIGVLFTVFTFRPPEIPFFRDPQTGTYGFQKS